MKCITYFDHQYNTIKCHERNKIQLKYDSLKRENSMMVKEELDGPAVSALGVRSLKLSSVHKGMDGRGWKTKNFYLQLLRASKGTLSCWSRLHLQSLAPTSVQGGLTSGRRLVVKIIAESLSQHDEKHVVPTPLSRIREGKGD
jgi:hypothetical protein